MHLASRSICQLHLLTPTDLSPDCSEGEEGNEGSEDGTDSRDCSGSSLAWVCAGVLIVTVEGHLFGVPSGVGSEAVFALLEMADEAGLNDRGSRGAGGDVGNGFGGTEADSGVLAGWLRGDESHGVGDLCAVEGGGGGEHDPAAGGTTGSGDVDGGEVLEVGG